MDAESVFSTDALVWPLVIAAVIYIAIVRPFYRRGGRWYGGDE